MIDKSLSRGLNDFFFVECDDTPETEDNYIYTAYMDEDGVILLSQMDADTASTRYWVGTGTFATIWSARTDKTYVLPSELIDPRI